MVTGGSDGDDGGGSVSGSNALRCISKVDLPAPLGPSNATRSEGVIRKLISRRTSGPPP